MSFKEITGWVMFGIAVAVFYQEHPVTETLCYLILAKLFWMDATKRKEAK
jgi:hypothetical protein